MTDQTYGVKCTHMLNVRDAAHEAAYAAYDAAIRAASGTHEGLLAYDVYVDARETATRVMITEMRATGDQLLEFLAGIVDMWTEAVSVMRILPATLEEIDMHAEEMEWCESYSRFRDEFLRSVVSEELNDKFDELTPKHLEYAGVDIDYLSHSVTHDGTPEWCIEIGNARTFFSPAREVDGTPARGWDISTYTHEDDMWIHETQEWVATADDCACTVGEWWRLISA